MAIFFFMYCHLSAYWMPFGQKTPTPVIWYRICLNIQNQTLYQNISTLTQYFLAIVHWTIHFLARILIIKIPILQLTMTSWQFVLHCLGRVVKMCGVYKPFYLPIQTGLYWTFSDWGGGASEAPLCNLKTVNAMVTKLTQDNVDNNSSNFRF